MSIIENRLLYYRYMNHLYKARSLIRQLSHRQRLAVVLVAVGITGLIIAIALMKRSPPVVVSTPAISPTPIAIEPRPEEIARYEVSADMPKYFSAPSIGISQVRIFAFGVNQTNTIVAPPNLFDAGWYQDSAKPGQAGAMFVYGHVSSSRANGAFYNLGKLKTGDKVKVIRGDNTELTYKVVSSESYPVKRVPMDKVLSPITAGQESLNLMTCAGEVDKDTNEFSDRLVIYTSRVNN